MAADSTKNTNGTNGKQQDTYKGMDSQNKRRAALGVQVRVFDDSRDSFFAGGNSWYLRGSSFGEYSGFLRSFLGVDTLLRSDRWKMLRRARDFLSRRSISADSSAFPSLYCRSHDVVSVLDCFPSLKYSYSAPLPGRVMERIFRSMFGSNTLFGGVSPICYFDFYCNSDGSSKKARFNGISRSGSIRLDPVDAVRQLYLYRLRIQRCLSWGYAVGLVPIMMTVTVFHRWHPLKGLLNVLSNAWNYFFNATTAAVKRSKKMGLVGYIRRAEETINNGSHEGGYNSGWHPHYHVILFVPADKVSVVASMEEELQEAWFHAVNRFFEKEFGEPIDPSYEASFRRHGLFFSKVRNEPESAKLARNVGSGGIINIIYTDVRKGDPLTKFIQDGVFELRQVDDSEYMAKVFGCSSPSLYCGDTELTSGSKGSRVPFDLLLEDTAENVDLWVEYALATKGVRCFVFSHGFEKKVKEYFEEHPDRDPIPQLKKSTQVVAQISTRLYKIVEANFKVDEMMIVAAKGYEALCVWFRNFYIERGIPADKITDDMLPLPPNSRTIYGEVIQQPPVVESVQKEGEAPSVDNSEASKEPVLPREDKKTRRPLPPIPLFETEEERLQREAREAGLFVNSEESGEYAKEREEAYRRMEELHIEGQLSLFNDSVTVSVPLQSKPGRRKKFHYHTVNLEEAEELQARQAAKPKFCSGRPLKHDPANELELPEASEITEEAYGKFAYLLEQDPSDKRSRKEFLEELLYTYEDDEKFKKAMDFETLQGFSSYISLEIDKEEELEARMAEMEKEWERVAPQLEEQSKRDMDEAIELFYSEESARETKSSSEQSSQAAPPASSEQSEKNLINFDDKSADLSDEERVAAMLADENSVLSRADEVSRSPWYPAWYRMRINNMARETVLENTSIDTDSIATTPNPEESAEPGSPIAILEYLFADNNPANQAEKYEDEISLEARAKEVLNSQWYPESYRKRIRKRLRENHSNASKASNRGASSKSRRELEEDKQLLDMFLKEVANLPPEKEKPTESKDPLTRLFAKLGEGVVHFREAAMKRNANVALRHGKKRRD